MLKFFLSGLLAASVITVMAPHASIVIAVIAMLGLAALFIEWHGGPRRSGRVKARKALPKMKA